MLIATGRESLNETHLIIRIHMLSYDRDIIVYACGSIHGDVNTTSSGLDKNYLP